MQTKRIKIITVSPKSRKELMEKYGCSQVTLYEALRYHTHNERADAIRKDAVENFGGVENRKLVFSY